MNTDIEYHFDLAADLDLDPSCDYREAGNCSGVSAWIVWSKACTCGHVDPVRFFCAPCWTYRNTAGLGYVRCVPCGTTWTSMALIQRVEALR